MFFVAGEQDKCATLLGVRVARKSTARAGARAFASVLPTEVQPNCRLSRAVLPDLSFILLFTHAHTHTPPTQPKKKKNARRQRETDSATFDRFSPACIFDTHKTQRHTFEHRYTVPLAIPSGGKTSVRTRPNFAGFDRISTTSSFPVATRRGEETKRAY